MTPTTDPVVARWQQLLSGSQMNGGKGHQGRNQKQRKGERQKGRKAGGSKESNSERKTGENGRRAVESQAHWEALLDCCMVAAELFCGIVQTTTVFYRWRRCHEPRIRLFAWNTSSHDDMTNEWIPRLHGIASGHT